MFGFSRKDNVKTSRNTANERLQTVLMHDRIGATSGAVEKVKDEVIRVIVKHMDVEGQPEITLKSKGRNAMLDINIPIRGR
jgi:cell division topological specificity factor